MKLHQMTVIRQDKPKRRVGRGYGSGRAKTSGRGEKGQLKRGKTRLGFEGGQLPYIKRLPFLKGPKRKFIRKVWAVNVGDFKHLSAQTEVTLSYLKKYHWLPNSYVGEVKLLGRGEVLVPIKVVGILCSAAAQKKIEAAGGSVNKG